MATNYILHVATVSGRGGNAMILGRSFKIHVPILLGGGGGRAVNRNRLCLGANTNFSFGGSFKQKLERDIARTDVVRM